MTFSLFGNPFLLLSDTKGVEMRTCEVSALVVYDPRRGCFLLQRKDNTYPVGGLQRTLSLFGGEVEEGESPLAAVRREVAEELPGCSERLLVEVTEVWVAEPAAYPPGDAPEWCVRWHVHWTNVDLGTISPQVYSDVTEGWAEIVPRAALKRLLDDEEKNSGLFFPGVAPVLRMALLLVS